MLFNLYLDIINTYNDEEFLYIVDSVSSASDSSFREKPYARLKDSSSFDEGKVHSAPDLVKKCIERDLWPIELLLQQLSSQELARKIDYITDCRNISKFDPPRTTEDLRSEKYAYFAGLAAGDGGFNGPQIWSLVDGGKPHELDDSRKFIQEIKHLINKLFGLPHSSICVIKRNSSWELKIANKWFCRFIRYFFDLPKSYKKGSLHRPNIFASDNLETHFWRGVFDADGCVERQSYRISLSSATEEFLKQCRRDLEKRGIEISEIRKPAAYPLRVSSNDFEDFVKTIGFSHLRKRKILLEKLSQGSRNYEFRGTNTENMLALYYDLTKIEGLRIVGAGTMIKEFREQEQLYQKELADKIEATADQVYRWENDKCATPVEVLLEISCSKKELFKRFLELDILFKVGKRGNKKSPVNLPLEASKEIDCLASKCISTSQELRIRNKDKKVSDKLEDLFEVDVRENTSKYFVKNWTVARFFETFYRYEREFEAYDKDSMERLEDELKL